MSDPGVGDERVQTAELGYGLLDDRHLLFMAANVAGEPEGASRPLFGQGFCRLLDLALVASGDGDVDAFTYKRLRHAVADAFAAAGDQCCFAV